MIIIVFFVEIDYPIFSIKISPKQISYGTIFLLITFRTTADGFVECLRKKNINKLRNDTTSETNFSACKITYLFPTFGILENDTISGYTHHGYVLLFVVNLKALLHYIKRC